MFDNPIYGSHDFFERLHGNLRGWQAARAKRHAIYTQHGAPAASAATMQSSAMPRTAPPAPGPSDDLILVCYQYEQGRPVPVYAHAADLAVAAAQASTPPAGDGPEAAHRVATPPPPAVAPQDQARPGPAANTAAPPDFSEKSVQESAPPRVSSSAKQRSTLDLSPPTPPPSIRSSGEKAETIERLVAQHRADLEAVEARHTAVVQGLLAQQRNEAEAAEARRATAVEDALAQQRIDMEAAEARRTAALEGTLHELRAGMEAAEARHAETLAAIRQRELVTKQAKLDADDAHAFAELRGLLADQARVMKDEHDRTTAAIRDIAEMLAGLGENVSGLVMAVANQQAPTFPAPPRRAPAHGEGIQSPPRAPTPMAPWSRQPTPATTPAATKSPTPALPSEQAPPPVTQIAADSRESPPNIAAQAPVTAKTPVPAIQEFGPATAKPSQSAATCQRPVPNTGAPLAPSAGPPAPANPSTPTPAAAPARPLIVVRNAEPLGEAPPPTVPRTAPAAGLSPTRARACVTASLESFFTGAPPVTASASPTPRQRRAEEEAREREHVYSSLDDNDDESTKTESEDSYG